MLALSPAKLLAISRRPVIVALETFAPLACWCMALACFDSSAYQDRRWDWRSRCDGVLSLPMLWRFTWCMRTGLGESSRDGCMLAVPFDWCNILLLLSIGCDGSWYIAVSLQNAVPVFVCDAREGLVLDQGRAAGGGHAQACCAARCCL